MNEFVSLSEARSRLSELVEHADDDPVYLLQQNRTVGVLLSSSVFEGLLGRLEELEDLVSISRHRYGEDQPADERIPWEKAKIELDLA